MYEGLGDGAVWTEAVKGLIPGSSVGQRIGCGCAKQCRFGLLRGPLEHSVRSGGGAGDPDS